MTVYLCHAWELLDLAGYISSCLSVNFNISSIFYPDERDSRRGINKTIDHCALFVVVLHKTIYTKQGSYCVKEIVKALDRLGMERIEVVFCPSCCGFTSTLDLVNDVNSGELSELTRNWDKWTKMGYDQVYEFCAKLHSKIAKTSSPRQVTLPVQQRPYDFYFIHNKCSSFRANWMGLEWFDSYKMKVCTDAYCKIKDRKERKQLILESGNIVILVNEHLLADEEVRHDFEFVLQNKDRLKAHISIFWSEFSFPRSYDQPRNVVRALKSQFRVIESPGLNELLDDIEWQKLEDEIEKRREVHFNAWRECKVMVYNFPRNGLIHRSNTCEVWAVDVGSSGNSRNFDGDANQVAMKFFPRQSLKHFTNEALARNKFSASNEYILKAQAIHANQPKVFFNAQHASTLVRETLKEGKTLVMPLGEKTLFDAMHTEKFIGEDVEIIHQISTAAARALCFVNENGLIHGDFKPRNFVRIMGANGTEQWRLIDLDASTAHGGPISEKIFFSSYSPPEVLRQLSQGVSQICCDEKFDVWSFGAVFFELVTGTPLFVAHQATDELFSNETKTELCNWVGLDKERLDRVLPQYTGTSIRYYTEEVLLRCLHPDENARPSFHELLRQSEFFVGNVIEMMVNRIEKRVIGRQQHHFFLSHSQKEASGIAAELHYLTKEKGFLSWLDVRTVESITASGMRQGVEESHVLLMVCTKELFFRPYCIFEFICAIESKKPVVFLVEQQGNQTRTFYKYPYFDYDELISTWDPVVMARKMEPILASGALKDIVNTKEELLEYLTNTVFENYMKRWLEASNPHLIPYRRRRYESEAMIARVFDIAGFHYFGQERTSYPKKSMRCKIDIIGLDETLLKVFRFDLQEYFEHDPTSSICLVCLGASCESDVKDFIHFVGPQLSAKVEQGGHTIVAVQNDWFKHYDPGRHKHHKEITNFFADCEILPFRPNIAPNQHEYFAMVRELQRQIFKFFFS